MYSETGPSLSAIGTSQNENGNLQRQLGARRFYVEAKALHFLSVTVSLALAIGAPILTFLWPQASSSLGALGGGWLFFSRLVLIPLRDKRKAQGALAQESFDCSVLGLRWNPGLAEPLANEEIHGAARRAKDDWNAGNWYPTDSDAPWPRSTLICQRSNAVWARRQHGGYAWVVVGFASVAGLLGVVAALLKAATLASYLGTILLPALPAFLDAAEEARNHFGHSKARQRLEAAIKDELAEVGDLDESALRSIQDQIFLLRRQAPLIPEWFYELRRKALEADMRTAAKELAAGDP